MLLKALDKGSISPDAAHRFTASLLFPTDTSDTVLMGIAAN
jgi:hypothetical protein